MRQAKVHVSVMGDPTRQQLSLRGLQNAAGFLQTKVAKRIDTRYTPRLVFVLDLGVKRSIEISQILQAVLPEDAKRPPPEAPGGEPDDALDDPAEDELAP
jgi:ribosome-binding factor A